MGERGRAASQGTRGRALSVTVALLLAVALLGTADASSGVSSRVGELSFSTTSAAGGAAGVSWSLRFAGDAIPAGGTVTVSAPAGAAFPDPGDASLTDLTTGQVVAAGSSDVSASGGALTLTLSAATAARDLLALSVVNVTNPSAGTPYDAIGLSTSADPGPASPSGGSFTQAGQVSRVAFHASTMAAGATAVTWDLRFQTSASGGMGNSPYDGGTYTSNEVILTAPAGTFNGTDGVAVWDLTTGQSVAGDHNEVLDGGAAEHIHLYAPVAAGDLLDVIQPSVTNPGAGTSLSAVTVATTADPAAVAVGSGAFSSPASLTPGSFSPTTAAGGATGVTWTLKVRTSATGGTSPGGHTGAITVTAPAGTGLTNRWTVLDETTGATRVNGNVAVAGQTVTIGLAGAVRAGDWLTLIGSGLTNPAAGTSYSGVRIATSSDTQPVPAASSGSFTTAGRVAAASFGTTDAAGGATATWAVRFSTGATGALAGGANVGGSITINGPSGTTFTSTNALVLDETIGVRVSGEPPTINGSSESIPLDTPVAAGDVLEVVQPGVRNPSGGINASQISVQTSSDSVPVTAASFPAPTTGVSAVSVGQSSTAGGATGVNWRYTFVTSTTGGLDGSTGATITLGAPTGTTFPSSSTFVSVQDDTSGASDPSPRVSVSGNGSTMQITLGASMQIGAGDEVTVLLAQVSNPAAGALGAGSFSVATSADTTPASPASGETFVTAAGPAAVTVSVSSAAGGAAQTNWLWSLRTSGNGLLVGRLGGGGDVAGAVVLSGPAGTSLPANGCGYTIIDLTNGIVDSLCFNAPASTSDGGASVQLALDGGDVIAAGDRVDIVATGVGNPPPGSDGAAQFTAATSSDTAPGAAGSGITFGAPGTPGSPSLTISDTAAGSGDSSWIWHFTASPTGRLDASPNGFVGREAITVTAPSGTTLPAGCGVELLDESNGTADSLCFAGPATTSNGGSTDTLALDGGTLVEPGDEVDVILDGVTNPGATAAPASAFTITTSADTGPASPGSGTTFSAPNAPLDAYGTAGTSPTGLVWSLRFRTSGGGTLLGGPNSAARPATITIDAPNGATFGAGCATVVDETQGESDCINPTLTNSGATATITLDGAWLMLPGDGLHVIIPMAATGSGPVGTTIATSSDTTPATVRDGELPATTITGGVSGTTTEASPSFSFVSSIPGATFRCELDGPGPAAGTPAPCNGGSVTYQSLAAGAYTFSVTSTSPDGIADPLPALRAFTVAPGQNSGGGTGAVTLSVSRLDFGVVPLGKHSGAQTLTVTNSGSGGFTPVVTITGAGAAAYSVIADACSNRPLAAGASCALQIDFTPGSGGEAVAALQVGGPASGAFAAAELTGTGKAPLGSLVGTVSGPSGGLTHASVSVCTASTRALCRSVTTGGAGAYSVEDLPVGSYQIEVFPAAGNLTPGSAVADVSGEGATRQDFVLGTPVPLTGGVSFSVGGGNQSGGEPVVRWDTPFSFSSPVAITTSGPPNGLQMVTVVGAITLDPGDGTNGGFAAAAVEQLLVRDGPTGRPVKVVGVNDDAGLPVAAPGEPNGSGQSVIVDRATARAARGGGGGLGGAVKQGYDAGKQVAEDVHGSVDKNGNGYVEVNLPIPGWPGRAAKAVGATVTETYVHHANGTDVAFPSVNIPDGRGICKTLPKPYQGYGNQFSNAVDAVQNALSKAAQAGQRGAGDAVKALGDAWNNAQRQVQQAQRNWASDPSNPINRAFSPATLGHRVAALAPAGSSADPAFRSADLSSTLLYGGAPDGDGWPSDGLPLSGGRGLSVQFNAPSLQQAVHGAFTWSLQTFVEPVLIGPGAAPARVAAGSSCGNPPRPSISGSGYVDPSGSVVTRSGAPVPGARVTLLRASGAHGRLSEVPNHSAIMSPANRRNPDRTDALGSFGWEVVPGQYEVTAAHPGCGPGGHTGRFPVPPPVRDLRLVLRCAHLRRSATRITGTATARPGGLLTLMARVRGHGRPLGEVTFRAGRRVLGAAAVDARTGIAVLTVQTSLAPRRISVSYSGDGTHRPSRLGRL